MTTLTFSLGITFLIMFGALISLGCLIGVFRSLQRKRLIDDTPTLKTKGVFIGLAELKGTSESDRPLTSYVTETPCVQYEWEVSEKWSRQVVETYKDADGNTRTRTRTESGWKTVDHGSELRTFYLKDDTGVIRVDPENASINGDTVIDTSVRRGNPMYYEKGPLHSVANSDHVRRFRESIIPLHAPIYLIGHSRMRDDAVAVEIAYDEEEPLFIISTSSEKEISKGHGLWAGFWLFTGLLPSIVGPLMFNPTPSITTRLLILSIYLSAVFIGWFWVIYNSLVSLRNSVDQAWSLVDIELKRRSDLIPNLVSILEEYQELEEDIQILSAELRTQAYTQQEDNGETKGISPVLKMVVEKYPNLFASELFLRLQQSLVETEQRIALSRDYFNEIAFYYNTRLEVIPDTLIGKIARLRPRKLFTANDFERAQIDVELVNS